MLKFALTGAIVAANALTLSGCATIAERRAERAAMRAACAEGNPGACQVVAAEIAASSDGMDQFVAAANSYGRPASSTCDGSVYGATFNVTCR